MRTKLSGTLANVPNQLSKPWGKAGERSLQKRSVSRALSSLNRVELDVLWAEASQEGTRLIIALEFASQEKEQGDKDDGDYQGWDQG